MRGPVWMRPAARREWRWRRKALELTFVVQIDSAELVCYDCSQGSPFRRSHCSSSTVSWLTTSGLLVAIFSS